MSLNDQETAYLWSALVRAKPDATQEDFDHVQTAHLAHLLLDVVIRSVMRGETKYGLLCDENKTLLVTSSELP